MNEWEYEANRLRKVIKRYADIMPFDKLSSRQLHNDLHAIAGESHVHRRSIGSDECLLCGYDLRHDIHERAEQCR